MKKQRLLELLPNEGDSYLFKNPERRSEFYRAGLGAGMLISTRIVKGGLLVKRLAPKDTPKRKPLPAVPEARDFMPPRDLDNWPYAYSLNEWFEHQLKKGSKGEKE